MSCENELDVSYYTYKGVSIWYSIYFVKIYNDESCMKLSQFDEKDIEIQNIMINLVVKKKKKY